MKDKLLGLTLGIIIALPSYSQTASSPDVLSSDQLGNIVSGTSTQPTAAINEGFVAFESTAQLVPLAPTSSTNVFIRDLTEDAAAAVSLANVEHTTNQPVGQGVSGDPSISPVFANRCVITAFTSTLRLGPTPLQTQNSDIYFRIPESNTCKIGPTTDLVSAGCRLTRGCEFNEFEPSNGDSKSPSLTILPPRTVRVAFVSQATNLTLDQVAANTQNIFLALFFFPANREFNPKRDMEMRLVSDGFQGAAADGDSDLPKISGDGRFVVFDSQASNLLDTNPGHRQIYLYEVRTKELTLISKNNNGDPGDNDSFAPTISYDGRFIAYNTIAKNLPNDGLANQMTNALTVVLHDRENNTTSRINVGTDGSAGNGTDSDGTQRSSVSADGRFVTFADDASNLVANDTNGVSDIFLTDLENETTTRVVIGPNGVESDGDSNFPTVSSDGFNSTDTSVVFSSTATNLLSSPTSGQENVYRSLITFPPPELNEDTELTVPPDVSIARRRSSVELKEFADPSETESVAFARRTRIVYKVVLRRKGAGRAGVTRRTVRRNRVTFRRLRKGNYNVKYRVVQKQGKKTTSRTNFSPPSTFSIG